MVTNYNDGRLAEVETQRDQALEDVQNTYQGMIDESGKYYQAQIDATKAWEKTQSELQQQKTDFAIEQIEQQKEQAQKDYTREQSGAYVDWQKESNKYGANAEQMASNGMTNTGYSESSQVSIYNTYQNRVATAREAYSLAVQNYNNAITEAQLQNSSVLAEIAYQSLQQQLEISLAGFQYKNQLVLDQLGTKMSVDNTYHSRYQDVLSQINTENALAQKQTIDGSSDDVSAIKKDNDDNQSGSKVDVEFTGIELGQALSKAQINALGLDGTAKIVVRNDKYCIKQGTNYIEIDSLENLQHVMKKYGFY
ncbi:MAG: hypothetical protein E7288_10480 [Lachnospiraceae bacterium]|nr:hypothetical protein [Lachnospiraceae bacterium]